METEPVMASDLPGCVTFTLRFSGCYPEEARAQVTIAWPLQGAVTELLGFLASVSTLEGMCESFLPGSLMMSGCLSFCVCVANVKLCACEDTAAHVPELREM